MHKMTNPKTRKTGKTSAVKNVSAPADDVRELNGALQRRSRQRENRHTGVVEEEEEEGDTCIIPAIMQQVEDVNYEVDDNEVDVDDDMSLTRLTSDAADETLTEEQLDDEEEEEEEDEVDSNSSFSLQECINEFRARRRRRISTQSREATTTTHLDQYVRGVVASVPVNGYIDPADADLINQNRSNKEHERKCKPCQNGFCYCFTSDSGEGGGVCTAARVLHVRQTKRNRKSEEYQLPHQQQQQKQTLPVKEPGRQSAPANLYKSPQMQQMKTKQKQQQQQQPAAPHLTTKQITYAPLYATPAPQLTAVSRLETTEADAPLIHIIQELHENCVISEVRVNKHKIRAQQRSRSLNAKYSPRKVQQHIEPRSVSPVEKYMPPSAPPLDDMNELDVTTGGLVYSSPLNSSSKSNDSSRRKHKAAGRLLQKRLGHAHHVQVRPRNLMEPPPKPPRSSLSWEDKSSVSTLASSSVSVREAERILDDFLRRKGVRVPEQTPPQATREHAKTARRSVKAEKAQETVKREQRKSYPLTYNDERVLQSQSKAKPPLPSCPSLSDIERVVGSKKSSYYEKNIQAHLPLAEKPVKELSFGWKEPKITEMLNYDSNGNEKQFDTRGVQAEPQELGHIGWQVPPKVDLDTVDGGVRHNLAANIGKKHTPVKSRLFSGYKLKARDSQKFILAEQWRNLSPWSSRNNSATQPPRNSSLKTSFLRSSKKKILRLVSPKKENKNRRNMQLRKTPLRTVGVQTSQEDLRPYENSSTPQSPPGSYHSAVQTSQQSSSMQSSLTPPHFDFSRTVQSPPKKAPRATQRRLNFPLHCGGGDASAKTETDSALTAALKEATLTKTYRSFHSDLDQDVTLSKMGYILGNIRAKLEASDEHAIRTFQEIERREQQSASFDVVDAPARRSFESRGQRSRRALHESDLHEPIYSEIEEDSIHIKCSPQFDNKTGIQHFSVEHNPEVLYAKVQKAPKSQAACKSTPPMPLGKFLHDSLKNKSITPTKPLPPEPELCVSSDVSYDSPTAHNISMPDTGQLPHAQSLNNIRVMEQHSPPKCNRHLSKSDLSLQRSEIFLENLCRSEIIVENGDLERLQKVDNCELQQSAGERTNTSYCSSILDDADVSYDLPNDETPHGVAAEIAPPRTHNQSTPKKQTFLTKPHVTTAVESTVEPQQLSLNLSCIDECVGANTSNSCPNTPRKMLLSSSSTGAQKQHAASLNEMDFYLPDNGDDSRRYHSEIVGVHTQTTPTLSRYRRLKDALRKSLRKSKDYVRNETKRLSTSLNLSSPHSGYATTATTTTRSGGESSKCNDVTDSSYNLDSLFALDDVQASVKEQLARAVSICRQLPDLEISPEMVEAERLLLYATLQRQHLALVQQRPPANAELTRRYYIDGMRLPLRTKANQDLFFNYFYICTFECGGHIKSTQSVECHNGEAIFRDCGIEFDCDDALPHVEPLLTCQVFMLRLRKVSTLSLEPHKPPRVQMPGVLTPSPTSSASSSGEIISRFRVHANFTLRASDFAPYEYVPSVSQSVNKICLRASRSCHVPFAHRTKSSNLSSEIVLTGRAEARFPKQQLRGYLNVQQPFSVHNWNCRWCELDGLQLFVWLDELQMSTQPLLSIDLCANAQTLPLTASPRELCARPRAFCLQCDVKSSDDAVATAAVFFAADTQNELVAWLEQLNVVLDFVAKWLH